MCRQVINYLDIFLSIYWLSKYMKEDQFKEVDGQ